MLETATKVNPSSAASSAVGYSQNNANNLSRLIVERSRSNTKPAATQSQASGGGRGESATNNETTAIKSGQVSIRASAKTQGYYDLDEVLNLDEYKISLSDQVKVGFYSSDRATQTNENEILDLKSATSNLEYLCKEIDVLKYDLKFAKTAAQSKFDQDLYNKSVELYNAFNEKLRDLKFQHEEKVEVIRRAHNSKLAAVVAHFSSMSDELKVLKEANLSLQTDRQSLDGESTKRIRELMRDMTEKEMIIKNLKQELIENTDRINAENEEAMNKMEDDRENALHEAKTAMSKIIRLENALNIKDEEYDKLMVDLGKTQMEMDKVNARCEELEKQLSSAKANFEQEKLKFDREKSKMKKEFDSEKVKIETKLNQKFKDSREQITKQQQMLMKQQEEEQKELLRQKELQLEQERMRKEQEMDEMRRAQMDQQDQLEHQHQLSLMALQNENENARPSTPEIIIDSTTSKRDAEVIYKLKNNEQNFKAEIVRLKREIDRNNGTWEKKFEILKQNLHSIKNEMYTRQTFKKQQTNSKLSYASIAYTMSQPPQFPPLQDTDKNSSITDSFNSNNGKPVLPSINNSKNPPFTPARASAHIETARDDKQIIGDEEMSQLKSEFLNDMEMFNQSRK